MHYIRPLSIEDAVGLLAGSAGTAAILAGGSDLLVRMKGGFVEPDLIVDIKAIDGLSEIRETADGFSIGAAVPCAVLGESAALKKAWPGVVEAAKLIGSKQVQGRCTIAGNLCNASPAADSVPALVAAGARASVVGPGGRRTIPVESVPTGPGKTSLGQRRDHRGDPARQARTALGRCLSAVHSTHGDGYRGGQRRREPDARRARCRQSGPRGAGRRGADGASGGRSRRGPYRQRSWTKPRSRGSPRPASAACRPIDDKRGTIEFRRKVAGVLAKRAATTAYARAGGK